MSKCQAGNIRLNGRAGNIERRHTISLIKKPMNNTITIIGKINSSLKSLEDCPLQENENAPEASITIFPEFTPGIKDIEANSEILLLTWLHQADRSVIQCIPRRNYGAPEIG